MSLFFSHEDGYFTLTGAGYVAIVLLIVLLLILTALVREKGKEAQPKSPFSARQIVFCAAALALGFATSYMKLIHMPWGGSVTLCSMLFVTMIGYWYGPRIGILAGFSYGFLQFIQGGGGYILSPLQVCLDYIFAFAALGLSGLFYKKANGLLKGYLFAVFMRGMMHSVGGYLFWMDYMPDNFPRFLSALYPICYNYAYLAVEAAITSVIICIPAFKRVVADVKKMAVE